MSTGCPAADGGACTRDCGPGMPLCKLIEEKPYYYGYRAGHRDGYAEGVIVGKRQMLVPRTTAAQVIALAVAVGVVLCLVILIAL